MFNCEINMMLMMMMKCVCVSLSGGITVTADLHCKALTRCKRAGLK